MPCWTSGTSYWWAPAAARHSSAMAAVASVSACRGSHTLQSDPKLAAYARCTVPWHVGLSLLVGAAGAVQLVLVSPLPRCRGAAASLLDPAAQDKYLELAPEPLHIDEWWVDSRTWAALETSVGLGEYVTFTADQTRPLRLTRSQVRRGSSTAGPFRRSRCCADSRRLVLMQCMTSLRSAAGSGVGGLTASMSSVCAGSFVGPWEFAQLPSRKPLRHVSAPGRRDEF